ncbi:MAG: phosphodiester glycosidase family protein [Clostridiales bacterium]|nr:phosphodiester glycosidase family protein [Clostridiales bacterium]
MKMPVRILLWALCAVTVLGMPFVLSAPNQVAEPPVDWDEGAFAFLLPSACAEEVTEENAEEAAVLPDEKYALPVDFSAGMELNPAAYTENGYQDDSISVQMETREVDGVKWRIAYVQIKHPSQLRTAAAGKLTSSKTALPSSMAKAKNAVVAINADYFSNDPEKTRFEFRQGEQITKNRGNKFTNNIKDVLVIDANGDFHTFITFPKETYEALMASDIQIVNAFMFGPTLVHEGETVEISEEYGYNPTGNEPRTAIGQTGPLSYVLVVAEGRTDESEGVTQQELADFMFELGCVEAFNLDGGNSATMVYKGELYMDKAASSERAQSDIIYFASAVDPAAWQE